MGCDGMFLIRNDCRGQGAIQEHGASCISSIPFFEEKQHCADPQTTMDQRGNLDLHLFPLFKGEGLSSALLVAALSG